MLIENKENLPVSIETNKTTNNESNSIKSVSHSVANLKSIFE